MGKLRVGILFGGRSVEHEVSLQSARNVCEAIDPAKFDVELVGIDKLGRWHRLPSRALANATAPTAALPDAPTALSVVPGASLPLAESRPEQSFPRVDVMIPLLHGTYGEDGTVQGLLKLLDVPCVGAGVLGSAIGMDKDVAKRLLRDAGLPVAKFRALSRRQAAATSFELLRDELGAPFFVKPANAGSSVGVSKVRDAAEWDAARTLALRFDHKLLVEEFIRGREIEVAVLGNGEPQASVVGEIVPAHEFYSYEAKYLDEDGAALVIPARIPTDVSDRVRRLAVEVFTALECSGMARVDFFLQADGQAVVNEINTIPGFTKISMYPKLWEATGLAYRDLITRLVTLALERHREDRALETSLKSGPRREID